MKDIKKIAGKIHMGLLDCGSINRDTHKDVKNEELGIIESILREELEGESVTKIDQTCDKPSPLAEAIHSRQLSKFYLSERGKNQECLELIQQVIDHHLSDVEGDVENLINSISVNKANFQTMAESGRISGSLFIDLKSKITQFTNHLKSK